MHSCAVHAVAQYLRHCATGRKVAGSITHGVTGIVHAHSPSGRTMALGIFLWGKGSRCLRLTTLPHSCADCREIRELQIPATLMTCTGVAYA
jgi:hypothetical protein